MKMFPAQQPVAHVGQVALTPILIPRELQYEVCVGRGGSGIIVLLFIGCI